MKTRLILTIIILTTIAFWIGKQWSGPMTSQAETTTQKSKQLWTCSMHPQVIKDHPGACPICHMELTPLKQQSGSDAANHVVNIDPSIVQNMGVRTAHVKRGPLVQSVHVVGYLEEPEPFHHDVNLRVSGWIEKLYANIDGMAIEQGKPLFDLYSPELIVAVDEMIASRKQLSTSPLDSNVRSLYDSTHRKLLQYGLGEQQVNDLANLDSAPRTIPFLAPMSGHLTAKMVYEGSAVKAGDLVVRLASNHRMWINTQVYEQQLPLISDGQTARITVVSQPGKILTGKVLFIHPHMDPLTRTALVRIEVPNEDVMLREGMYATVELLSEAKKDALIVPREAVIDTGRRQIAFVALGDGHFEPRDVELGAPAQNGMIEVLKGLDETDIVVTSGQFLIDSESRLQEAINKHLQGDMPTAPKSESPEPMPAADAPATNPTHEHHH